MEQWQITIIRAKAGLPGICCQAGASRRFAKTYKLLRNRPIRDFQTRTNSNPGLFSSCLPFFEPNNSLRDHFFCQSGFFRVRQLASSKYLRGNQPFFSYESQRFVGAAATHMVRASREERNVRRFFFFFSCCWPATSSTRRHLMSRFWLLTTTAVSCTRRPHVSHVNSVSPFYWLWLLVRSCSSPQVESKRLGGGCCMSHVTSSDCRPLLTTAALQSRGVDLR